MWYGPRPMNRLGSILLTGILILGASRLCKAAAEASTNAPPPAEITADALRDAIVKKYGEGYLIEVDEKQKLVFATGGDRTTLDDLRKKIVEHADVLHRELFPNGRGGYLAVVIPKEWRGTAKGFFQMEEHTVLLKSASGQVMHHEFTHAAHLADQEARGQLLHQNWIIEGLAALFENYRVENGRMVPLPNHRLKIIQNLARGGHHKPWETYVKFSQKEFMKEPGNHYSQARYMFIYVYEQGLLKKWYQAYVDGYAQDPTGGAALEKVFGKKLPEIEKDWVEWLLKLPPADAESAKPPEGN